MAIIKALKDAGVVIPSISPLNSFLWPVQKIHDGSWRGKGIIVALRWGQLQLQLLYQIWFDCFSKLTHPLVPGMKLLVSQTPFFSLPVNKSQSEAFYSQQERPAMHLLTSGAYHSSALGYNLVHRDFDSFSLPSMGYHAGPLH